MQPKADPIVPAEILEQAKRSMEMDQIKKVVKCSVCGAETSQVGGGELLCWVCRRLKASAWRDIEPQLPVQE